MSTEHQLATVGALIEHLKQYPQDALVMTHTSKSDTYSLRVDYEPLRLPPDPTKAVGVWTPVKSDIRLIAHTLFIGRNENTENERN